MRLPPVLACALLLGWGAWLVRVYLEPGATPGWALRTGTRRAFLLTRQFEPTVFTLLFGVAFLGLGVCGLAALWRRGRA